MYLSLTRKYIPCASGKVRGTRTARYIIARIRSDNKIYYRPSPYLRQTSVSPPILGESLSDPRVRHIVLGRFVPLDRVDEKLGAVGVSFAYLTLFTASVP